MIQQARLLFFVIAISVLLASSFTAVSFFGFAFSWSWLVIVAMTLGLFLSVLIYLIGDRIGQETDRFYLKWYGAVSMGILSISFSVSCIGYITLWFGMPLHLIGWIGLGCILGMLLAGLFINALPPVVSRKTFSLGQQGQQLRLVHLSDLHLNGLRSVSWVKSVVDRVNELGADVIVFTGDLADVPIKNIKPHLQLLSNLSARIGCFAVSGNHDFSGEGSGFSDQCLMAGFTVIDNQRLDLDGLTLLGLPDPVGAYYGVIRKPLEELMLAQDRMRPCVLLDHRPDHFKRAAQQNIDLQLSGHTHAGQIPPWNLLVRLRYAYPVGLHRRRQSMIYVSRGTGAWGPPLRLFCRSEIACFDLSI